MMKREAIVIDGYIPALVWGDEEGDRLFVAVHGDQSHKADEAIAVLAEAAVAAGYRVLSFDLPEHGERCDAGYLCKVQNCVRDLRAVICYARLLAGRLSVFGVSMGAYFSLMAWQNEPIERCLFLSPVVDMCRLIENMMGWFGVDPQKLEAEQAIETPMGKTLYWDYYCYVREQPVDKWPVPTAVLCGENDDISEFAYVSAFCERFGCALTVMEGGEHFFHNEEQLVFFREWVEHQLASGISNN